MSNLSGPDKELNSPVARVNSNSESSSSRSSGITALMARQTAVINASETQGTEGLLGAISKRKDHFPAMQTAYQELSNEGTVLQLHGGGRVIPGTLAMGLLGFLKWDSELILFQVTGFDESVELFKAASAVDRRNQITFTRHEMSVFPIVHVSQLAWYQSDDSKVELPLAGKLPRGAFYHSVCPLGVTIVDAERSLGQVDCGMMSTSASAGGMSPPAHLPQVLEVAASSRQHDPSKQRVNTLSPNLRVVFNGELSRYTNSVYSCVYDAIVGRGAYGGRNTWEELPILVSSAVCIQLMSAQWVDLYWFATQPREMHVMSRVTDGIVVMREDWVSWSVDKVEGCWANACMLFDIMFGMTQLLREAWGKVWIDLQSLKLSQARFYTYLVVGWIQYEILDEMGSHLFAWFSRPNVTEEELLRAVEDFRIDADSVKFNKSYTAKEKLHLQTLLQQAGKNRGREPTTDDPNPTLSKKQRKAKAKAAAAAAAAPPSTSTGAPNGTSRGGKSNDGGVGKGHRKSPQLCFNYLSTGGCHFSDAECRFTHTSAAGMPAPRVKMMKDGLELRQLTPDPAKF
jgi:hypothetical protein